MKETELDDRRVRRTRLAIFNAFNALVLSRRYDEIRVADIIEAADVGRSTFYDHFKSKDDVLLRSIEPLFDILADTAAGQVVRERLFFVLSHFWDQRALARVIFGPALFFKLTRKLADMIELRLDREGEAFPRRALAIDLATSQLGVIKAWLTGEFACDIDAMTDYLVERVRSLTALQP